MDLLAQRLPWNPLLSIELLPVAICLAIWAWCATRWRQRQPIIRYQPRQPVPWQFGDLAIVVLGYLTLQPATFWLIGNFFGAADVSNAAEQVADPSTTVHVVGQLIAEGNIWVLLLCGISAVIIAPVAEEFFFRILVQGWLETVERRARRKLPLLRARMGRGVGPILLTSALFATMHFRVEQPPIGAYYLVLLLASDAIARVLSMALAVGWLRWRVGATATDFGWSPQKIAGDIKLGLLAFGAIAIPIYGLQFALHRLLPAHFAPDPIPLFFLSLALGALYFRTHRLVPTIVLHASLNATSLALAWLAG
jgi:membrane protease YdiL (CAAX protease family)